MTARKQAQSFYPFSLPPLPDLDAASLKKVDLWNALEFFRIEALLRSKQVEALYAAASQNPSSTCPPETVKRWKALSRHVLKRKGKTASTVSRLLGDDSLRNDFFVDDGWLVLWGAHHRYLRPDPFVKRVKRLPWDVSDGILDLVALARAGRLNAAVLLQTLTDRQTLYSYVQINNAVPPEGTLQALRPILQTRHQAVTVNLAPPNIDPISGEHSFPFHPRKLPAIHDVRAWMQYLECYDLSQRGHRPDAIARQVYGDDASGGAEDNAKKAISRIRHLIAAAEKNAWPPTNLK